MRYLNKLDAITSGPPILGDCPEFVEPLLSERRFMAPALVMDPAGELCVRTWRYWYNARGTVEMEHRLEAAATAVLIVHPWGVDDGEGPETTEPAGVAFLCTREKNLVVQEHIRTVVRPFLDRLRKRVAFVGYSLPGKEDPVRKLLYSSVRGSPTAASVGKGRRMLKGIIETWPAFGKPLVSGLTIDSKKAVGSYFKQTPAIHVCPEYDNDILTRMPMPLASAIRHHREDIVFYDDEGYTIVRRFLKSRGIRHVLLGGYCTDVCVAATTCGYANLSRDFNVFIVGDATLAAFPASTTPRFATQAALASASLSQLITQCGWVKESGDFRKQGRKYL